MPRRPFAFVAVVDLVRAANVCLAQFRIIAAWCEPSIVSPTVKEVVERETAGAPLMEADDLNANNEGKP